MAYNIDPSDRDILNLDDNLNQSFYEPTEDLMEEKDENYNYDEQKTNTKKRFTEVFLNESIVKNK